MRYDSLLQRLEKARTAYENTVRGILEDARKQDEAINAAIVGEKPKRRMTAKRRRAIMKNLAKARAAKKAKQ